MDNFVADFVFRYLARPTQNKRHSQATLHSRMVGATPWASSTTVRLAKLWPVVAAENKDSIFFDTHFFNSRHNLSNTMVHLHHGISKIAGLGAACRVRMRQGGKV